MLVERVVVERREDQLVVVAVDASCVAHEAVADRLSVKQTLDLGIM
jgi:hypothetical protein